MLKITIKMMMIMTIITVLALPFQDQQSPEYVISLFIVLFNSAVIYFMRRHLKQNTMKESISKRP